MKITREPFWEISLLFFNSVTRKSLRGVLYSKSSLHLLYCFHDTLLWEAASYSQWDLVRICIPHVNVNCIYYSKTPLESVIYSNNPRTHNIIILLLEAGADTGLLRDHAVSALIWGRSLETIRLVSKTLSERQLSHALDTAARCFRPRVVKLLLGRGVKTVLIKSIHDYAKRIPPLKKNACSK